VKVLLTRPGGENARMAAALTRLGATCLEWPLTRIVPLVERLEVPPGTEAILFTSANAVRAYAAASAARDLPVFAVGDRTAAVAREAGFAQVTSARGDAQDLARLARATRWRRFLHPRGREAAELAVAGAQGGAEVVAPVVYAAEPAGPPPAQVADALATGAVSLVTIWSPRHALILRDWLATVRPPLAATALLGISEAAAAPLRDSGFATVLVADRPDAQAMIDRAAEALRQ
jgi:uroporphyrinogen-III synthase